MAINTQTKNQTQKTISQNKILRFSKGERLSHWVHAIAFFTLLFTGLGVLSTFFQPGMVVFGGIQVARLIHRGVAVVFVVVVGLMFFVGDTRDHWYWLKAALTWTKADVQHVMAFPKEFFGGHGNYPPQDKFNGGEKINSLFTIFGSFFITLSGIVLWFAPFFPAALVRWSYPVHDLAAFMMATAITGHLYLSILHPLSNPALKGIINGYVSTKFAQNHYAKWYDRVKDEQNIS